MPDNPMRVAVIGSTGDRLIQRGEIGEGNGLRSRGNVDSNSRVRLFLTIDSKKRHFAHAVQKLRINERRIFAEVGLHRSRTFSWPGLPAAVATAGSPSDIFLRDQRQPDKMGLSGCRCHHQNCKSENELSHGLFPFLKKRYCSSARTMLVADHRASILHLWGRIDDAEREHLHILEGQSRALGKSITRKDHPP